MTKTPSFQSKQKELAQIIRDNSGEIEGIECRRIDVYQELFFNNVESFCSGSYPVLKSLFPEQDWLQLVREFFINHQCESPHFIEIAQEFLQFLLTRKSASLPKPFMMELAHYEWVELASSVAQSPLKNKTKLSDENWLLSQFVVPESTYALSYQYAVHQISADNQHQVQPKQTALLVYRDTNFDVKFMLTDLLSVIAIQLIQQNPKVTGEDLQNKILVNNPSLTVEALASHLSSSLTNFQNRDAIISF